MRMKTVTTLFPEAVEVWGEYQNRFEEKESCWRKLSKEHGIDYTVNIAGMEDDEDRLVERLSEITRAEDQIKEIWCALCQI